MEQLDEGDNTDLLLKIKSDIKESRRHYSDWLEKAKESYAFYASEQWTEEDKAILEEQSRVPVVFNRIARTVNGITGLELQNRQEPRFLPRQVEDSGFSDTLSQAAKWVRDCCDAEDEESDAFTDTIICGMGWTETLLSYESDAEGMILVERRDPLNMLPDWRAKKRNLDDAKFIARIEKYSVKEFADKFPDAETGDSSFLGDSEEQPHNADILNAYKGEGTRDSKKEIEVCQYQYYKLEHVYMVENAMTKESAEFSKERLDKLMQSEMAPMLRASKTPRPKRVYKQVLCTSSEVLEEKELECGGFTLRCITGLRDRNNNIWFGIVEVMKDPQRWANKWLSQIQHILNTQAKSGKVVLESGAVANPNKFRDEWADVSKPAIVNPGTISQNKFMQIQPAQYPDGIDRLLGYALEAINDTAGANMELLGLANRSQAGVLEESRKQAGMTMFASLFDALRRYRKEQGRVLAEYIRLYLADGRLMRIVGDTGAKYVPLLKDQLAMKYDIVMDDAPNSPNQKERTFAILNQILPIALQSGIPVPPDVLDYAPLPEQLSQKWKNHINEQGNNPEVQEMKQLQKDSQAADTQGKKAKAMLDMANAEKAMAEARLAGSDDGGDKAAAIDLIKHEREIGAKVHMKQMEIEAESQAGKETRDHELRVNGMPTPDESTQKGEEMQTFMQLLAQSIVQSNNNMQMIAEQMANSIQANTDMVEKQIAVQLAPNFAVRDEKGNIVASEKRIIN